MEKLTSRIVLARIGLSGGKLGYVCDFIDVLKELDTERAVNRELAESPYHQIAHQMIHMLVGYLKNLNRDEDRLWFVNRPAFAMDSDDRNGLIDECQPEDKVYAERLYMCYNVCKLYIREAVLMQEKSR